MVTEEEELGILFKNGLGTYGTGARASLGAAAARVLLYHRRLWLLMVCLR